MTPAQRRKLNVAIKEYRGEFLRHAADIASRFEYNRDVTPECKRDFIAARHKHQTADHLRAIMDGEI